ncbi:NmrA family NAD(P)-binding protein [Porphyrobacter sp. ULC335]|uniref:NmrA family NAD(P)-binding protein n=1 Tax=Porphyrobacter sp. ULC335 TaxID=2854260 RepID=UPI00221F90C2|nr:NmrA family NAD(P)-binding protein [Porphyrobacter sp. ULC335]UYV16686.1 NmrA family NAD(P)-binding protein [Porphyrobacter sp. ULC335]
MDEQILVTGGAGKTGQLVAGQLARRGIAARIATRRPCATGQVRFEWNDPATHAAALESVTGVYLVAPTDQTEHLAVMRPFLERARTQVPGRLVLLSASSLEAGGPMMGEVHAWLSAHAALWTVLRPTWFMQNFTTQHRQAILEEGCLYSATGDGRVPFIDAADIAAVAAEALTDSALPSGEHVLTGPEALTYDEVAYAVSARIGRAVRHCRLSANELAARYAGFGIPRSYALTLAGMDEAIAQGSEDRITMEVERITGRPANTLAGFLESQRDLLPVRS